MEILFSPGASHNPFEVVPLKQDHTLPVLPRMPLHAGGLPLLRPSPGVPRVIIEGFLSHCSHLVVQASYRCHLRLDRYSPLQCLGEGDVAQPCLPMTVTAIFGEVYPLPWTKGFSAVSLHVPLQHEDRCVLLNSLLYS